MRKATVLDRQSLWDIAIREYGSTEALFDLLRDNPSVAGPGASIAAGQLLDIRAAANDAVVVDHYHRNALYPVTGTLLPFDDCLGYPCIPRNQQVHSVVYPTDRASLESGSTPVGRKYFVIDLAVGEDPETTSLFARHTGYIMQWLGEGATNGVEGTPWMVLPVQAGSVIETTAFAYYKSWPAASGTADYPSGRFGLEWLPEATLEGGFKKSSIVLGVDVEPTFLSPCRWFQVERQSLISGGPWEAYGDRRRENDSSLQPLTGGMWLYRVKWTTGPEDDQCLQGYSATTLVI